MSSFEDTNHVGWRIFNQKRKLLKDKYLLEDKIDSLDKDIISASGKQDYNMSKRFNQTKKACEEEINLIDEVLDNFKYFQQIYENLNDNLIEFYNQFLNFNEKSFLSIHEDIFNIFDLLTNGSTKILSIGHNVSSNLSGAEIKKYISSLYYDAVEGVNGTYLSFLSVEIENYYFPIVFVPVIIENPNDYKILRNYNKDIKINPFIEELLNEENIQISNNEDFKNFFIKITKLNDIQINPEIILSNFNFSKIQLLNDMDFQKWDSFKNNITLMQDSEGIFQKDEIIIINNNISKKWPKLNFKYDYGKPIDNPNYLIKNLLSTGNSILLISDDNEIIKKSLIDSNLESLLLDINSYTTQDSLKKQFDIKLLTSFNEYNNLDVLTQKKQIEKILKILKTPYLNYNFKPIKIKELYEKYSKIINKTANIPFKNISSHDKKYYDDCYMEIIDFFKKSKNFNNFKDLFNGNLLNEETYLRIKSILVELENAIVKFNIENLFLNKNCKIKLFDTIEEASLLVNLNVLNKSYRYVEKEDILYLNDFIKKYSDDDLDFIKSTTNLNIFIRKLNDLQLKLLSFDKNLNHLYENYDNFSFLNENVILIEEIIENIENIDFDNLTSETLNRPMINKYFQGDDNPLSLLENHIKYTELIDYGIIENEFDFNNNLSNSHNRIEKLYQLYKYILKQLHELNLFLDKNRFLNLELIDENITFDQLRQYVHFIGVKLEELYSINGDNYSEIVKSFVNYAVDNQLDESELINLYYYNFYKSLYESLILVYPILKDIDFDYEKLELKLKEIDENLWDWQYNNFMENIFRNVSEVSPSIKRDVLKLNIKTFFMEYKNQIMEHKRVFITDMENVYELLDNSYESCFDYVIVNQKNKLNNYELISLMLRSKNKIICL